MKLARLFVGALVIVRLPVALAGPSGGGTVTGKVTYTGTPSKPKVLDLSKEPACVKIYSNGLTSETVITGPGNTLQNVVVYVSAGPAENSAPPVVPASYDQQGCHYTTHVLPVRVGQEIKISNSDPFSHNIHPLTKNNREWNKMQLPGTPPFVYSFENEEFIPVKCNLHPWMQGYFVVLKTSHFAVTGQDGRFSLPELPPGNYTITAWHETYGTQRQEITVAGSGFYAINFVFEAKP